MRHFVLFLALCAIFSLPLAAQATRAYQPPTADEKKQLETQRAPELAEVRAGDELRRGSLTTNERDELNRLGEIQNEAVNKLRLLRAGDHWGWYVAVPCLCGIVIVLIILIIIF